MAKKKSKLSSKYVAIVVAIAIVIAIVTMLPLPQPEDDFPDEGIVSTRSGIVTEDISCIYFGENNLQGHFGQYAGNVFNEGNITAVNVSVVVEFLDENGSVVGSHETLVSGDDVNPGAKKSFFSYTEKGSLSAEFVSCRAKVE